MSYLTQQKSKNGQFKLDRQFKTQNTYNLSEMQIHRVEPFDGWIFTMTSPLCPLLCHASHTLISHLSYLSFPITPHTYLRLSLTESGYSCILLAFCLNHYNRQFYHILMT